MVGKLQHKTSSIEGEEDLDQMNFLLHHLHHPQEGVDLTPHNREVAVQAHPQVHILQDPLAPVKDRHKTQRSSTMMMKITYSMCILTERNRSGPNLKFRESRRPSLPSLSLLRT